MSESHCPSNEDLAWCAGFFDGEGCSWVKTIKGRKYICLEVAQKDPRPLERFLSTIYTKNKLLGPSKRGYYKITFVGQTAISVFNQIEPWLSEPKREQFKKQVIEKL